ncbi:MAG TPA: hypothetical protein VH951_00625 [Dehalococcoidia bacterium]
MRWHWRAEAIFGNERMLGRVRSLLDECRPDIVVFEMSTYQFLHREVTRRIGRRWPPLYGPSLALTSALKRLSAGDYEGAAALRSKLLRLPRQAAFAVVGGEAELALADSLRYAFGALDEVLRREHVTLICSMPKFQWYEPERDWCLLQREAARAAFVTYCEHHHVPTYDLEIGLRDAGLPARLARDGIHYGRESRDFEAGMIAPLVLQSLRA